MYGEERDMCMERNGIYAWGGMGYVYVYGEKWGDQLTVCYHNKWYPFLPRLFENFHFAVSKRCEADYV